MADNFQTPEQAKRDIIDAMLERAGWKVQSKNEIDFNAGLGIAVREYPTDVGPADYVLFVDKKPTGVVEAKPAKQGHKITTVEEQSRGYANANLKWVDNKEPLPFVYESTGELTRFTDSRDPRPRSREVFNFHRMLACSFSMTGRTTFFQPPRLMSFGFPMGRAAISLRRRSSAGRCPSFSARRSVTLSGTT